MHHFQIMFGIAAALLGAAAIGLTAVMVARRKASIYVDQPEEKNPLEGCRLVFVPDETEPENADGVRGHLEPVGKTTHVPGVYDRYLKRGFDAVLSFVALVLLSPVYAALALAIRIDDPGPVLFTQKRVGRNKQYFKLHKFRSMKMGTPHDVPTHMLENPDQYTTRVGRFIRAHSLDELPQIWDIFIGNMAFIGPRPALWNQDVLTAERDRYNANDVRPGLTGWAQINGRDTLSLEEKARLDGEYVKREGLLMDIKCFLGSLHVFGGDKSIVEGTGTEVGHRKKILIITNHSYMLWQFRRELIDALQQEHEVVLSMPFVGHEEDFQNMGLRCVNTDVDRRGINPKTDLKLLKTYQALLKAEKPDLVITYSIKPNIYAGMLCGRMGIPFCANVQGLGTAFQRKGLAQFVTALYRTAFRKVKMVFFENEANAEEFCRRGILSASKLTVLHGAGINLQRYALQPYPQNEKLHFLYLGRIMQEKGMDELFTAARSLYEIRQDFVLDLVGFFEEEYKAQVERLEQDGIAVFHGFQFDACPYYRQTDCVIVPSWHEGMSNVNLEAAASGRPVITTDIPGCREAVEHTVTGLLVPVKDANALRKAMEQLLDMSADDRAAMGIAARTKMEREFDKTAVVIETIRKLGLN